MRRLLPHLLLVLLGPTVSSTAPSGKEAQLANVEEDVLGNKIAPEASMESDGPLPESSTKFNGIGVPPMKDLNGPGFDTEAREGYWFVKHYSPYCHHCQKIAPLWQTLYEFYYTSKPVETSSQADHSVSLNSFHGFYNFHFGSLNCIQWGDTCTKHDIEAWPTFILYKDGKEIKRFEEKKDMEHLSEFIEETLDSIKPGSRPAKGFKLPEPGATEVEVPKPTTTVQATKITKEVTQTATPNLAGASIPLNQEKFQKSVTQTQEPWFIKFYAPWCHHCQAMAPNWAQLGRELQGQLNIGEVNCEAEKRLCKEVGVRAYPTIHFFRGGERVEYNGLRGLGDLVTYAKKALDIGSGVQYVDSGSFKKMEENEEVIFVYFYDHATTEEDFQALDRLTLSLIGHAKLVKTDSAILADRFKIHTWPRLLVVRDGRPSYYNALTPGEMRNFRAVLEWMQSVWLPIVPELTASNAREIMNGRFVVLGILSRENVDEFVLDKSELKNAALEWMEKEVQLFRLEREELRNSKQLRIEEAEARDDQRALVRAKQTRITVSESDRQQVGFAWVDGVFWERWLRTTYGVDVSKGERVIINDEDHKRYWDTTISGAPIMPSRSSILETLTKITQDSMKISPKYTTNKIEQLIFQARGATRTHPAMSSALFVIGIVIALYLGRKRLRRPRKGSGGFFNLDNEKGILGNGSIGKND